MSTIKKMIILTTMAAVFTSSHYTLAQEYSPEESYVEFRNAPSAGTVAALTAIGIATAIAIALRHRSNHGHGHGHSH